MTPPVDPNDVLMTVENSFIRLSRGGEDADRPAEPLARPVVPERRRARALRPRASSPRARHASTATTWRVARWLQRTIEACSSRPSPIRPSRDPGRASTAPEIPDRPRPEPSPRTTTGEDDWYDCIEPFVLNAPPGFNGRPIGVVQHLFPARSAQVEMNGRFAAGLPWPRCGATARLETRTLAWSESG